MIKGIYKEFITVRISGNPLYEEAIFILKGGKELKKEKKDLVFEANRILCENGVKKPQKKRKLLKKLLFSAILLLLGAIFGAGATLLIIN